MVEFVRKALVCLVALTVFDVATSVELTFELLDNARDCFFEDIPKNTSCTLEFQVIPQNWSRSLKGGWR